MASGSEDALVRLLAEAAVVDVDDLREPRRFGEHDCSDRCDEDVSNDEDDDDWGDDGGIEPVAAARSTGPRTGIKGVMADKAYTDRAEGERRRVKQQQLRAKIAKQALVLRSLDNEDDEDDAVLRELEQGEDDFTREYRAKRMFEMRQQTQNRPVFGTLPTVTEGGFLVAVEKENPLVPVIVHAFHHRSPASHRMTLCLAEICLRYAHAKFVCFAAASAGFDIDVLPVLLVYQRGELVQSLVHTTDETGEDFLADDVEALLLRHHVLDLAFKTTDPQLEARLRSSQREAYGKLSVGPLITRDDVD